MEGEGQAADVDIGAVGVRGQNPGHGPRLRLRKLKLIQLLGQAGDACRKEYPVSFCLLPKHTHVPGSIRLVTDTASSHHCSPLR